MFCGTLAHLGLHGLGVAFGMGSLVGNEVYAPSTISTKDLL